MKKIFVVLMVISMVVLALGGCSSNKQASKSNFKKVLNAHFKAEPMCIDMTPTNKEKFVVAVPIETKEAAQLEALAQLGFVVGMDTMVEQEIFSFRGPATTQVQGKRYTLTKKGENAYNPKYRVTETGESRGGFCFATKEVGEVLHYTEPTSNGQVTVSQCEYTLEVKDIEDWAVKIKSISQVFPEVRKAQEIIERSKDGNPVKETAVMVLMGDGWEAKFLRF